MKYMNNLKGTSLRSYHVTHKKIIFEKSIFSCYQCFYGIKNLSCGTLICFFLILFTIC